MNICEDTILYDSALTHLRNRLRNSLICSFFDVSICFIFLYWVVSLNFLTRSWENDNGLDKIFNWKDVNKTTIWCQFNNWQMNVFYLLSLTFSASSRSCWSFNISCYKKKKERTVSLKYHLQWKNKLACDVRHCV